MDEECWGEIVEYGDRVGVARNLYSRHFEKTIATAKAKEARSPD